jgi:hypothetical protein
VASRAREAIRHITRVPNPGANNVR